MTSLDDLTDRKLADAISEIYFGHRCRDCLVLDWETVGLLIVDFGVTLAPETREVVTGRALSWHARCGLPNLKGLDAYDEDPRRAVAKTIIRTFGEEDAS